MPDLSRTTLCADPFEHLVITGLFGESELSYCKGGFQELSEELKTPYFEVAATSLSGSGSKFRASLLELFSGKKMKAFIEGVTGFENLDFCRVVCRSEPKGVSYPVHEDAEIKKVSMIVYIGDRVYGQDGTRLHGDRMKTIPFVPGSALVIPNRPGSPHSYGPFKQDERKTILINYSDSPELWTHCDPRYSLNS